MTPRWPSSVTPFSAAETPAETDRSGVTGASERSHPFIESANPRHKHRCERCGLPRRAHSPELHRTSVVGHLNLAIKAAREDAWHECAIHVGTAQKILEGDD